MNDYINENSIKSNIRRVLYTHPDFKDSAPSTISHDAVIDVVWVWTCQSNFVSKPRRDELLEFLDLARKTLGNDAIDDLGDSLYMIRLPNTTWLVKGVNSGYTISLKKEVNWTTFAITYNLPENNLSYMSIFDRYIEKIHGWIDEVLTQKAKDSMICDMIATSAKGIIEQLRKEHNLDVPRIGCIRGTREKRVILYLADTDEKINCPLDYLRVRLLKRFGKKKR